ADLAAEAWRRFQAIEAEGGLLGALASGAMQQRIATERARRMDGVAAQSIAIVGVNIFRAAAPTSVDVDAPCPAPAPAGGREFEPLPSIRASEDLESAAA
ncbi:MAG: methylmalonyl-CoA mutase, partial [Rhizobiales bacterium]|nr:methylmalonyl-CoA mutase [Hyphomicrobiales bacterium]